MSSIEELKDGTTSIDMTQNEKVDISTGKTTTTTREHFDPRTIIPKEEPKEEQPTVLDSILEGPNSMLGKYIDKRTQEMEERLSTFDEEKAEVEEGLSDKLEDDGLDHSSLIAIAGSTEKTTLHFEDDKEDEIKDTDLSGYNIDSEELDNDSNNEDDAVKEDDTDIKEAVVEVESPNIDIEVTTISDSKTEEDSNDSDDEVEDESDSQEIEDDSDAMLKHLRKIATEKIKPIYKDLDISGFTVVKKASTNSNLLKKPLPKAAKWVLMNQESIVLMKEFTGAELQALQEASENSRSLTSLSQRYRLIYDHIVSPKPASFESWLKVTPYADLDHYFFAIYVGAYKGANFVPRDCTDPKCKETFLTDDISIMSMTKFDSEESKAKFMDIYNNETVYPNSKGLYISEVVPVSENLAVSFRQASIYSIFESSSLDDKFRTKYNDVIGYIAYIDSIYIIDQETRTLTPVGYKVYPENAVKTVKSKIKKYAECLRTLTSDEFSVVRSYANEIIRRDSESSGLKYKFPSCTCPKCGKEIEEIEVLAEEAVFTRYQLGALVNSSLK